MIDDERGWKARRRRHEGFVASSRRLARASAAVPRSTAASRGRQKRGAQQIALQPGSGLPRAADRRLLRRCAGRAEAGKKPSRAAA